MKFSVRTPLISVSLAAALAFTPYALGEQAAPAEPQAPTGQTQAADVSDAKLRQFAKAAKDVQKIQQDYTAKAKTLQKDAEQQIVASVEGAGMSVAEFTELVALVQSNPDLARRLSELQQQ
ncbi:MAG TPA: DUF4168 domain-containing protein [Pseudomonadales bacterium]